MFGAILAAFVVVVCLSSLLTNLHGYTIQFHDQQINNIYYVTTFIKLHYIVSYFLRVKLFKWQKCRYMEHNLIVIKLGKHRVFSC